MANSFLASTLTRFVAPDHETVVFRQPFSVQTTDGATWAVAVSGPTLVAVRGKSTYPLVDFPGGVAVLCLAPEAPEVVDLAAFRAWCLATAGSKMGVVRGRVFDRERLCQLLEPVTFPRLTIGVGAYGAIPALVLDAPSKWRAVLAGIDAEPTPADPVWGSKSVEAEAFDFAMSLE
jgi:hypothetical protein